MSNHNLNKNFTYNLFRQTQAKTNKHFHMSKHLATLKREKNYRLIGEKFLLQNYTLWLYSGSEQGCRSRNYCVPKGNLFSHSNKKWLELLSAVVRGVKVIFIVIMKSFSLPLFPLTFILLASLPYIP